MSDRKNFNRMLGRRIRLARCELNLTQEALSSRLGFRDRQTLSAIEAGTRNLKADELALLIEKLGKPLSFFTDPFLLLPGEVQVSWRASAPHKVLRGIEPKLKNIIAAYREFGNLLDEPHVQLDMRLDVRKGDSFERVTELGEALSSTWGLKKVPADTLGEVIEEKLNILFLSIDFPRDVSGAAFRIDEFSSLLINRTDPSYRRNYDLAHELFHLLTWDRIPPREIVTPVMRKKHREEMLADAFAAGLLMPRNVLAPRWKSRDRVSEVEWINRTARILGVSGEALYWRLVNLGWMKRSAVTSMKHLARHGKKEAGKEKPLPLYSRKFVDKLHRVLDRGFVSVKKAAVLLDCTYEDLAELFEEYGKPVPFDL